MHRLNEKKLKVRPLIGRNLEGELYARSEEVEAQINEAINLDSVALIERARISCHKTPGFLQEECLVCLIRAALGGNDDNLVTSLFEILFKRCVGFVYRHLGFEDKERRDDAYNEVVSKLVEKIIDLETNKADFLQVRFWVVVEKVTITAFSKYLPGPLERNIVALDVEAIEKAGYTTNVGPLEELMMKEVFAESKKVLLGLSERHLDVFIMRHKDGWPIESKDPDKITLSKHFGATPRTIRNWLTEGLTALKKSMGEKGK